MGTKMATLDLTVRSEAEVTNITEPLFTDFPEYQAAKYIWRYFPPFLFFIGTAGSVVSLIVLCRRRMRTSTTMFYLSVLAVTDVIILYTGLLRYWLFHTFDVDIRLISNVSCKVHVFAVYVSLDFAAWILVALTVDRCICVRAPFKAKKYCTLKKAKVTIIVILIVMLLVNGHLFYSYGLGPRTIFGEGIDCDAANQGVRTFASLVWPWIDFCIVCAIPFTSMIVCDCILIRHLANSARKMRQHNMSESERREELVSNIPEPADSSNPRRPKISTITTSSNSSESKRKYPKASSLTVMLLSVNCLFLLLTSPIVVYLIGFGTWRLNPDPHSEARLSLGWCLVNMLQYTNNAAHFFLYCLTGPRFRRELLVMFAPKNRINVDHSVSHHVNTGHTG